ncbi:hypothetical protein N7499_003110 [Penicillium canescens]|uniref:DUF3669 domain-containing protein n=1 Tax=Penicillium canescens TaxID=5083 RepID=A0AAD6N828_PENCN|nr:uncharacterized protein N7446_011983 [Penicillium canescens]KAJ6019792.1 hypothetical protein N7522_000500 [Penicillium canescens]KAJ6039083.1 hypothetical protein N7460_007115 [Penicillium canescens]KAJ6047149.1 hypothetical protein N7446_011983 [Penicillium canescens]KAJ6059896.1 hypothetical protein N7444_003535 [Penicillium canescens]KAJ6093779.1 hypothetical protein N7499_003110 [Penicillium canescens]
MSDTHTETQGVRRLSIIGAGICSTTWAPKGDGPAFKFGNDETDQSLENEFKMHERVVESFQSLSTFPRIQVPDCYNLVMAADEDWWNRIIKRLPTPWAPGNCILAERVLPFPKDTMLLVVHSYCSQEIPPDSFLLKECLIKPYLGCCQPQEIHLEPGQQVCSQVDLPLHLYQMKKLGVPEAHIKQYARTMAEALAIMHWIGSIDGKGVEFVLAPPWGEAIKADTFSNVLGDHCMWMLDFGLCRDISMDEAGVQQAVKAFWHAEPFYPRPATEDPLWLEFREQYLRTSEDRLEYVFLKASKSPSKIEFMKP